MRRYLQDKLGSVNRFEAYSAHYRIVGFSTTYSDTLARVDCDRTYNKRHVPAIVLDVYIDKCGVDILMRTRSDMHYNVLVSYYLCTGHEP